MKQVLKDLSDQELVAKLNALVAVEKKTTHEVVLHLVEVERRRLDLSLGYGSIHDYAVKGLKYSESAAYRRINAARVITKNPEFGRSLEEGKVTLSGLQSLAQIVTPANAKEVLEKVESGRAVDRVIAEYKPVGQQGLKDRIVPVAATKENKAQGSLLNLMENVVTSAANAPENTQEQDLYRISVTVGEEVKEKLDRVKELNGYAELSVILNRMLDCYLKTHCPKEKQKRREVRKAKPVNKTAEPARKPKVKPEDSPYVPAALEAKVLKRDNYCCAFVGKDADGRPGVRCGSRSRLEIDHCQPFAMGGKTVLENLRTLCSNYNKHCARKAFGDAHVDGRIASKRNVRVKTNASLQT